MSDAEPRDAAPEDATPDAGAGAAAGRRPRRERSAREQLLSTVLALEAVVVVFATFVAYGLSGIDPFVVFVAGGALIAVLFVVAALQRYPWAVWLGWAMQLVLLSTALIIPMMVVVMIVFGGMWIWAFVRVRQIEAAQAAQSGADAPGDESRPGVAGGGES